MISGEIQSACMKPTKQLELQTYFLDLLFQTQSENSS